MRIALLQVPYHLGRENTGMGLAPQRYIDSGVVAALEADGHDVVVLPVRRTTPFADELQAIVDVNVALSTVCVAAVRDGRLPVVAGGNCNVALGMVAGLRRAAGEPLGIAWFDAHGDFNTPQTSPGGFLDGMPLAMAVGRAHRDAVWSNLGDEPVAEAHALHVGARDLDPGEELNFQAAAVLRVTGSQLSAGGVAAAAEAFRQLAERVPAVYLHIDIDVLDPRFVPAIDFPTPGGLSPDELLDLVAALRAHLPFAGISLTAYDPVVPDPDQLTLSTSMAVLARLCRLAEE